MNKTIEDILNEADDHEDFGFDLADLDVETTTWGPMERLVFELGDDDEFSDLQDDF